MPPNDLAELLKRLRLEAQQLLKQSPGERRSREEDEESERRFLAGSGACEELLVALEERGGDSA